MLKYFNMGGLHLNQTPVDYKQGGSVVATGLTGSDGVFYITLPTGTYDVAVCYPDRPNDSSSGVLNNYYHSVGETVNITLYVFY